MWLSAQSGNTISAKPVTTKRRTEFAISLRPGTFDKLQLPLYRQKDQR
jgi:hypothetical protein